MRETRLSCIFFWGEGCPHCAKEKVFLEGLEQKYSRLEVRAFETWHNRENTELFEKCLRLMAHKLWGVPTTFIEDFEPIIGDQSDQTTGKRIEKAIRYCLEHGCVDPIENLRFRPPSRFPRLRLISRLFGGGLILLG